MTVITMSRNELTRLRVPIDVADGRLSVADATGLIGVGRRQIYRLLQTFRADGPDGVISRKRGRPRQPRSGCGVPRDRAGPRARALRRFWPHLGGREVVRAAWPGSWDRNIAAVDIGAGLWVRRKDRIKRIHQPRPRRDCLGELVQIDGSEHWWFEDRGPQSTLLVYIDDATSRLMHLKFVETESTFDYFQGGTT